jgi:ribosome-binding protein aMBF1 (putative translation factor)
MIKEKSQKLDCRRLELDGIRYVIIRESLFDQICRKAKIKDVCYKLDEELSSPDLETDKVLLAKKLIRRRQAAGLSQIELARRSGIRPETLNRIERGKTTPDFATIRKLVMAINEAERENIS